MITKSNKDLAIANEFPIARNLSERTRVEGRNLLKLDSLSLCPLVGHIPQSSLGRDLILPYSSNKQMTKQPHQSKTSITVYKYSNNGAKGQTGPV